MSVFGMPVVVATAPEGVTLECARCAKEVVLPTTERGSNYVSITPLTGWTAPPLMCPDCSEKEQ